MSRFGFSTEPSSGGDFLPIVKYDARAGRMFRVERTNDGSGWATDQEDITHNFKAIVDFENVETGWINFATGGAPDFRMVPMGQALPERPSPNHKNGIRFMLKLAKDCGGDKPIREISGQAKVFLNGIEKAFDAYEAEHGNNPGKLPVLVMEGSTPVKTGTGDKQSTNYMPRFKIVGWADRGDLVFQAKGGTAPAQPKPAAPANTPPATGSTRVEPPTQKAESERELVGADDFG